MKDIDKELEVYIPSSVAKLKNPQTDIPRIAKNEKIVAQIESGLHQIPTKHTLYQADSRDLSFLADEAVHLFLTSPPYWTLKKYHDNENQLGDVADYDQFLNELDKVWHHCFNSFTPVERSSLFSSGEICMSRGNPEPEVKVWVFFVSRL